MSPDDPRHGTRRGYYAHRRDGEDACAPCKRGAADAEAQYEVSRILGRPRTMPAHGTQRRLKALRAMGWTWTALAPEIGVSRTAIEKFGNEPRRFVYATTAERVAVAFERLAMVRPEGWVADRTRTMAARRGDPPPLAWDDIDDPDEVPKGLRHKHDDGADPVVVQRILAGEWTMRCNQAEREAVVKVLHADGLSDGEIASRSPMDARTVLRIRRRLGLAANEGHRAVVPDERHNERRRVS